MNPKVAVCLSVLAIIAGTMADLPNNGRRIGARDGRTDWQGQSRSNIRGSGKINQDQRQLAPRAGVVGKVVPEPTSQVPDDRIGKVEQEQVPTSSVAPDQPGSKINQKQNVPVRADKEAAGRVGQVPRPPAPAAAVIGKINEDSDLPASEDRADDKIDQAGNTQVPTEEIVGEINQASDSHDAADGIGKLNRAPNARVPADRAIVKGIDSKRV